MPEFPEALSYLWEIFIRLANRRQSNGFGPERLGWAEIDAFCRLTRTRLAPWEVEIIERLDDLYLVERKREDGKPNGK